MDCVHAAGPGPVLHSYAVDDETVASLLASCPIFSITLHALPACIIPGMRNSTHDTTSICHMQTLHGPVHTPVIVPFAVVVKVLNQERCACR